MLRKLFNIKNPKGMMGINKRNIELIYANNNRQDYKLADDKVKTKKILHHHGISCAETYTVIHKVNEIRQKWNACKKYSSMAIKPSNGFGGGGIMIIKRSNDGHWIKGGKEIKESDVLQHISCIVSGMFSRGDGDSCLIEERIVPHHFFSEIYNEGVPDFRIIVLKNIPLMAMLRMPTSKSGGMANLHQDGVGIGINMDKGTLTQVYDGKNYLNHHPDNPKIITDTKIPYWDEILNLSVKTSKSFPLNYLGIDLVIDENKGPQIMEVNVRPGLSIQMVNQCGMEKVISERFFGLEFSKEENPKEIYGREIIPI